MSVLSFPTGRWEGPIPSGYGPHMVFVHERIAGRLPPFEEVKDAVRRAWGTAQREAAIEKLYATLLRRYRLELAPGQRVDVKPRITLMPKHGMRMIVRARRGA